MPSKYMPSEPVFMEKLIAVLSYISSGWVGFFWLLIALVTKNGIRPYLKYHIFQSIFISFLFFLLGAFLGLIMNIISVVPGLGVIAMQVTYFFNAPIFFGFSAIQSFMIALMIYLVVTCFQGRFSYVPWISDIIKANVI